MKGRRNRKARPPLRQLVPPPRELGRLAVRAVRASLPALAAFAVAGAVGAGGSYGYHWLTASEEFAVERIELTGDRVVTEARIRRRLGIEPGDNIFKLGLPRLERMLESDPWVRDAEVGRRLPDTLIIEIEEEVAAALVELDGLYLADASGRIFKRAAPEQGEGEGLPIITGLKRDRYVADPEAAATLVREALEALALYRENPERPAVAEIHLDPRRGTVLHTYRGAMAIRLGDGPADELKTRLGAFDAAWGALDSDERAAARVVYVDNQTRPDRVTVGFGNQQQAARRTDG